MMKNVLQLELCMTILAAVGLIFRRRNIISKEGQDCLTDILMDVLLPCNIFLSFQTDIDAAMLRSFGITILISMLVMFGTAFLGKVFYRKFPDEQQKVFRYGLVNSNGLLIGLPLIQSMLGDAGALQVNVFLIFMRMFCWSYGLSLYTGERANLKATVRKLLVHPCMLAAEAGFLVMILGIPLPGFLTKTMNYFASCMMAVSMMLVGAVLANIKISALFRWNVWIHATIRLLGIPALVLLGCSVFHVPYIVTATCTLISGMPAASMTAVLAARYRKDAELAALLVAVSTVMALVTIPLWFIVL